MAVAPVRPLAHRRVAQGIATAWLFTGQSLVWPGPLGVPLALLSTGLCVGLLFSRHTRALAAGLAALIALTLLGSPTWFAHNRLFVCAVLAMVSLSTPRVPWLPRVQVALVFFMAALDKALDPAWRDGRFVTSFVAELARFGLMWAPGGHVGGPNPLAGWLSTRLSDGSTAGLAVIALEFAIALSFLFDLRGGAALNALFHVGVFTLTGGTMGQFFFAGVATSLLLVKERSQPSAALVIALTVLLAGPWTHRYLPALLLGAFALHHSRMARNWMMKGLQPAYGVDQPSGSGPGSAR